MFLYLSRCFSGHHQSFFLISDFPAESVKPNKNYQKISHILQTSAHLTLKIISSRNTAKNISGFTNFPVNMYLFGVRKDICTQYFLTPKNCTLEALWKETSVYFFMSLSLYFLISLYFFIKFLLQTRSKFLSGGGWDWGGRLNNFLKAARCLGFAHCFTIFCFDWNFWKFNYFSAFRCFYRAYSRILLGATIAPNLVPWVLRKIFSLEMTKNELMTPMFRIGPVLSIALKCWNFPDSLDFNGKIVAKFFIWSHFPSI